MDNVGYHDGVLSVYCKMCGHCEEIKCSGRTAERVMNRREPIQNILPKVPADVREMFITGWCGVCYDLQLMHFPMKAIKDIEKKMKELIPAEELPEDFELTSTRDIMSMLEDLEWYDGETEGFQDLREQTKEIRAYISKVADLIDDGVFYDNGIDDDVDWTRE